MLDFALYLLAAICFALAFFGVRVQRKPEREFNLVALGLLLWILVPLIHAIDGLA